MRLIIDGKKAVVTTQYGSLTLGSVYRALSNKAGRTCGNVAKIAGVEHAQEYSLRNDRTNSVKTFMILLDELGYDVVLRKRKK